MKYYTNKIIKGDFESVIHKVTEELKGIGFGVLTSINVQATLKERINEDFKPYVILGACNPHFASRALRLEETIGAILPCNVVVIDQGEGNIEVVAMDPMGIMESLNNPELTKLASEVSEKMSQMIQGL